MTRRRWVGLAGLAFGVAMFAGVVGSGTTPDSNGSGAAGRYTAFWADESNQDKAALGGITLTYAVVLLACFAAGLRYLLRTIDTGPLPDVVLATGVMSASLLGVGAALVNGAGIAGAETGYEPDGGSALLVESIGYYALTAGIMAAAAMALAAAVSNRISRVLPGWTIVLSGLLALVGLGSIFIAWVGFMLLPLWAVVVGLCLLLVAGPEDRSVTAAAAERTTAAA